MISLGWCSFGAEERMRRRAWKRPPRFGKQKTVPRACPFLLRLVGPLQCLPRSRRRSLLVWLVRC